MKHRALELMSSLFGIAFLVNGCASVQKQAYDRASNAEIKRIALLDVDDPADYLIY